MPRPQNTARAPQEAEAPPPEEKANVPAKTASAVPAYLQGTNGGSSLAGIGRDDIALPSIRLLQSTSEQPRSFDDARPGIFWHTGFDMPLGTSLDFIICANRKKYMLMAPINDTRGVLARAEDGVNWVPPRGEFEVKLKGVKNPIKWKLAPTVAESGLAEYGSSNPDDPDSPPAAVLMYEHLVILPEFPELGPAFFTQARSQIKQVRRQLYPKIALHNNAGRPMQALRFTAQVIEQQGDEGPFYNVSFRSNGWATEEEFKTAVGLHEKFGTMRAKDEEEAAREAGTHSPESGAGKPAGDSEY